MRADPASLRPRPARDGVDLWRTPPDLIAALTGKVLPPLRLRWYGPIWEPGAGDGDIADPLAKQGYSVIASDVVPRNDGIRRHDYVHEQPPPGTHNAIAVTNPPYRDPLLDQFIARSIALIDRLHLHAAVLLLRWDHFMAGRRARAFDRAWRIWVCCWRPRWIVDSTG